ncbi:MAG: hypothetical protein ACE5I1_18490, partial [bacterium]
NTAPTTTVQLFNKSDLNTPIASATKQIGSRSLKLIHTNLQADTYYVRTVLAADANSWQTPYTIEVNKLSAPINLFSYADLSVLPADGSTANIFAELRMPNGNRHPTANNPVTFTITSGASSGILVGSNPVNATNGIASIQLLSTTTPGQVMIEASSPGLASSTTSVFVFGNPTPVSGTIRNNTTWTLTNSPYDVTGDIVIAQGVTLTIEPGVTVRFNSERDIYVDGALVANGTASQKIVFTANSSTPFAGLWGGVKFNNSSISNISILNHCQFLYGGQAFRSEDAPIVLNARANPTITNTSLLNNKRNGIHIVEGTYNSNINLNITGIPYFFTNNDIVVATGFTMTVSPGVIIKFGSERDLYVDGALVADGTPSQPTATARLFRRQGVGAASNSIFQISARPQSSIIANFFMPDKIFAVKPAQLRFTAGSIPGLRKPH